MNFLSDNLSGASPEILSAIVRSNAGDAPAYGGDPWSERAKARLAEVFGHEVEVFTVASGTASNALALAAIAPPGTAVFCHEEAHIATSECGAPEFFTGGCKLVGVPGKDGKMGREALQQCIRRFEGGTTRQVKPAAVSISQATEAGTVYSVAELETVADVARSANLAVHMDGARFANAVVSLGAEPAEISWKAGVDVLSFGCTKNGTMACEAVIFFNSQFASDFLSRRKRAGQTFSKSRFFGAQMEAYLEHGHWLDLARKANRSAARLAEQLSRTGGMRLPFPTEANIVFAIVPNDLDRTMRAAGVRYLEWDANLLPPHQRPGPDEVLIRLVCSYATSDDEVDRLIDISRCGA